MNSGVWKIEGYDGAQGIFEAEVAALSDGEMVGLLQRLASRHLTCAEVVAASLRRDSLGYAALLEPQKDLSTSGRHAISVGPGHHYVARVVEQGDA
jgi:hypothetical protein